MWRLAAVVVGSKGGREMERREMETSIVLRRDVIGPIVVSEPE
jgi:hypothetical protein